MRALIQRVSHASVEIGGQVVGRVKSGLVVLLAVSGRDDIGDARYIADKTVNLRIFSNDEDRFDFSALDVGAEILVVSQFTLFGDTRKGRRPSFTEAALPEHAEALFNLAVGLFRETGLLVETGRFQSHMVVSIHNDGPVTIMLDSNEMK